MSTRTVEELQNDLRAAGEALGAARTRVRDAELALEEAERVQAVAARDVAETSARLLERFIPTEWAGIRVGGHTATTTRAILDGALVDG